MKDVILVAKTETVDSGLSIFFRFHFFLSNICLIKYPLFLSFKLTFSKAKADIYTKNLFHQIVYKQALSAVIFVCKIGE